MWFSIKTLSGYSSCLLCIQWCRGLRDVIRRSPGVCFRRSHLCFSGSWTTNLWETNVKNSPNHKAALMAVTPHHPIPSFLCKREMCSPSLKKTVRLHLDTWSTCAKFSSSDLGRNDDVETGWAAECRNGPKINHSTVGSWAHEFFYFLFFKYLKKTHLGSVYSSSPLPILCLKPCIFQHIFHVQVGCPKCCLLPACSARSCVSFHQLL